MFNVSPIPIYEDNYVWLIQHQGKVAVVDPGHAEPVIEHLQKNGLSLDYILVTHKHWDHVSGIEPLKQHYPQCQVYGSGHEEVPCLEHPLLGGESLSLLGLSWQVIHTPGHTLGQIAFYVEDASAQGHLFSADNIFACGCGRMFEGSAEQYQASLAKLVSFPANTLIYGTHEYTLANIDFALHIEPNNTFTLHRQDICTQLRAQGKPTLPTTVGDELNSNPFLRWGQPDVIRAAEHHKGAPLHGPAQVFAEIRLMKDHF